MYKLLGYTFASLTFFSLIVGNVYVSSSLSTGGEELRKLEMEEHMLIENNQELKAELLQGYSLQRLQQLADQQGFQQPEQIISLSTGSQQVALNQ